MVGMFGSEPMYRIEESYVLCIPNTEEMLPATVSPFFFVPYITETKRFAIPLIWREALGIARIGVKTVARSETSTILFCALEKNL